MAAVACGGGAVEEPPADDEEGVEQDIPAQAFPLEATIPQIQEAMEAGRITAPELVNFSLARIAAYDDAGPELNALIELTPEAREEAAALDAERAASGSRGPLHGIPVVVKDNMNTADMPTRAGSVALEGREGWRRDQRDPRGWGCLRVRMTARRGRLGCPPHRVGQACGGGTGGTPPR